VKIAASPRLPLKSMEENGSSVNGSSVNGDSDEVSVSPPKKALIFENQKENKPATNQYWNKVPEKNEENHSEL
jgi:hypothetical protein